MSRQDRQISFRPPPDLAARIAEYQRIEHRGSTNEALIVLVMDALERWRLSKLRVTEGHDQKGLVMESPYEATSP